MDVELKKQTILTIRALYFCIMEQWSAINKEHGISSAQQHLLFILSAHEMPHERVQELNMDSGNGLLRRYFLLQKTGQEFNKAKNVKINKKS